MTTRTRRKIDPALKVENCIESVAGTGDSGRSGPALSGASQSNLRLKAQLQDQAAVGLPQAETAIMRATASARSNVCTSRSASWSWSAIF